MDNGFKLLWNIYKWKELDTRYLIICIISILIEFSLTLMEFFFNPNEVIKNFLIMIEFFFNPNGIWARI